LKSRPIVSAATELEMITMKCPAWVVNKEEWEADCAAIVQCTLDLLEGRRGIIESARVLQRLAFRVRGEHDADFVVFRGIDSESDALPVGPEREHWAAAVLAREDEKIRSYENQCRPAAVQSARRLMWKYGGVSADSVRTLG
jgi:hypothetical protein